jgi:hypothetical protein
MKINGAPKKAIHALFVAIAVLAAPPCHSSDSSENLGHSTGELVYVPVYSHIYVGVRGDSFDLAISLSVRNIDTKRSITVTSVDYHDSKGKLVRRYLDKPLEVAPLATTDFFVAESDTAGGFGAAFLVKWKSNAPVNRPIIEGVMAGTRSAQGISFTSRGRAIAPH